MRVMPGCYCCAMPMLCFVAGCLAAVAAPVCLPLPRAKKELVLIKNYNQTRLFLTVFFLEISVSPFPLFPLILMMIIISIVIINVIIPSILIIIVTGLDMKGLKTLLLLVCVLITSRCWWMKKMKELLWTTDPGCKTMRYSCCGPGGHQAFLQACSCRPRVCSPTPGAQKSNILIDCIR